MSAGGYSIQTESSEFRCPQRLCILLHVVDPPHRVFIYGYLADNEVATSNQVRHFHVPLHAGPGAPLKDTRDHVLGTLDLLQATPGICKHLEMETYTWEVLPQELRTGDVVDQVVREYEWTLGELENRGLSGDAG